MIDEEGTSVKNWTKNLPDKKTGAAKDLMVAPPGSRLPYGAALKKKSKIPNTPVSEVKTSESAVDDVAKKDRHVETHSEFEYKPKKGAIAAPGSGSIAKPQKAKASDVNKSLEQQMAAARKEEVESDWAKQKRIDKVVSDRLLKIHQEREARYQAQQAKQKQAKEEVEIDEKHVPGETTATHTSVGSKQKIKPSYNTKTHMLVTVAGGGVRVVPKNYKGSGTQAESKETETGERDVGSQAYTDYIKSLTPGEGDVAVTDKDAQKASVQTAKAAAEKKRQITRIDDAVDPEVASAKDTYKKERTDMKKLHILDVAKIKASKVGEEVIVGLLEMGIIKLDEQDETGFTVINDPVANRENLLRMAYNTGAQILKEKKVSSDDYDHATALYKDQWKDRKIADYDKEHDRDSRAKEMRADAEVDRKRMWGLTDAKWKHAKYATGEEEGKRSETGNTPDPKDAYKKETFSGTPNMTHDPKFGQTIAKSPLKDKETVRPLPKGATTPAVQKKEREYGKSMWTHKKGKPIGGAAKGSTFNLLPTRKPPKPMASEEAGEDYDNSLARAAAQYISEWDLGYKERQGMSSSEFALPGQGSGPEGKQGGSYPIPDESHARNALARVSQHGSEAEKKKVRAAVAKKFPNIKIG